MTHQERSEMERAAPSGVALTFARHRDARFARLLTPQGCPLLGQDNLCTIYNARPYNCRTWGCFREDVTCERVENVSTPARLYTDRAARRQHDLMIRRARPWGLAHGWAS